MLRTTTKTVANGYDRKKCQQLAKYLVEFNRSYSLLSLPTKLVAVNFESPQAQHNIHTLIKESSHAHPHLKMFFSGTLQEGISTALQQSKLVACFVTDDQEESKTWETEYLTDERIAPSLEKEAVILRLTAGSEEAGYLAAIFPLPKIPALVVIKNGQLKEYLASGTEKEEFVKRVSGALVSAQPGEQGQGGVEADAASAAQPDVPAPSSTATQPSASPDIVSETATDATSSASGQAPPGTDSPEHISNEGERRRQAARKERERIEKERAQRRKEKGKMPAEVGDSNKSGSGSEDPSKAKQTESVKKASQQLAEKQRQAREERARVLKLIADDRAERKAKEEMRKQEREAERSASSTAAPTQQDSAVSVMAPSSSVQRRHDQCAIQVRLFDGSTIRTRLPAKATLAQDVRPWIDENRTDGKDPYSFKVILTPLPNRAIDHATEEDKTLQELDLTPSSTLVLTPMERYATAYTSMNAGLGNPVSKFITDVLAFVVNILGGMASAIGGGGSAAQGDGQGEDAGHELTSSSSSPTQAQATGRDGGGRIQGFQNPDDRRKDYQLYNGNSVSTTVHYSYPLQNSPSYEQH